MLLLSKICGSYICLSREHIPSCADWGPCSTCLFWLSHEWLLWWQSLSLFTNTEDMALIKSQEQRRTFKLRREWEWKWTREWEGNGGNGKNWIECINILSCIQLQSMLSFNACDIIASPVVLHYIIVDLRTIINWWLILHVIICTYVCCMTCYYVVKCVRCVPGVEQLLVNLDACVTFVC